MSKYLFPQANEIANVLKRRRELLQQRIDSQALIHPRAFAPTRAVALEHTRSGEQLELLLYGVIGEDFWGDGVSALDVAALLTRHSDAKQITVRINSPGGDVFDGVAIYNALVSHGAEVHTIVDGLAASAASLIFEAGDQRTMRDATKLMIHRCWTYAMGNTEELQVVAGILGQLDDEAAQLYARRSGLSADEVAQLMAGDGMADGTYFGAAEAIEKGLADGLEQPEKASPKPKQTIDLSQLDGLRVAALYRDFPKRTEEGPVSATQSATQPPASGDAAPAGALTPQPAPAIAASFEQLSELAGDDSGFICAQMKANATMAAATQALVVRLREQATAAHEARQAAEKERDDLRTAGPGAAAAEGAPVSARPGGEPGNKKGRFVDLIHFAHAK